MKEEAQKTEAMPLKKESRLLPIAIIIGAVCIAGAILFTNSSQKDDPKVPSFGTPTAEVPELIPVDEKDHVLGNPNASIILVEYADFNCPYCTVYNSVVEQLMNEYGSEGDVAWVFRHFPVITQDSPKLAHASECVAEIGGEDAFWVLEKKFYDRPQDQHNVDNTIISNYLSDLGIDETAYTECMDSLRYNDRIGEIASNANEIGVDGTPHTFILHNGEIIGEIGGYTDYAGLKQKLSEITSKIAN